MATHKSDPGIPSRSRKRRAKAVASQAERVAEAALMPGAIPESSAEPAAAAAAAATTQPAATAPAAAAASAASANPTRRAPRSSAPPPRRDASAEAPRTLTFSVRGTASTAGGLRGGDAAGPAAADDADALPLGGAASTLRRRQRIELSANRDGGELHQLQAVVGEDVLRLLLDDGAELRLHPDSARELFSGMAMARAERGGAPAPMPGDAVPVPMDLGFDDEEAATRDGWIQRLGVRALELLKGEWHEAAADFTAAGLARLIDGRVDPGVYAITDRRELRRLKAGGGARIGAIPPAADGGPLLVLMHGTFVDTASTFQKLWATHPLVVDALFDRYGPALYALEHHTVGTDPFANALPLAEALPQGARLHLLTHSRGGLVAEVMARLAETETLDASAFEAIGEDMARCRDSALKLHAALRGKQVTVERIVRVACPARGTLLASGRLDVYLSGLVWLLRKAGLPVVPELLDFLNAVAQRRTDPLLLPGLQAMVPGSGVVQWLNDPGLSLGGQLRVVAGDLQADSIGGFFKTLLADAYYWTDNDIVVHTASMYGGSRRADARYRLHRRGDATHFAYFQNEETVQAVRDGLMEDAPAGYQPIGPLSWAGESSEGQRGVEAPSAPDPSRPAVFVLPGIMGSHLKAGKRRIWLGLGMLGGLDDLAFDPDRADEVRPDGALERYFGDLRRYLADSHDVVEFSYDWRIPIERSAKALAEAVDRAVAARKDTGQPVRILAHSMGGIVARTMALEAPDTWHRMMAHPQARFVMLGTPNGGSWAPMQVLTGDDAFGNFVAAVGMPTRAAEARRIIAGMPGLLSLQAGLTDPALKLDRSSTWQQLAQDDLAFVRRRNWWNQWVFPSGDGERPGEAEYRWGVPPQRTLDAAKALRLRLDRQAEQDLPRYAERIKLVVGQAKRTPDGIEVDAEQGFTYLEATGGDGRVPLHSALLPGVRTWLAEAEHADLARWEKGFKAYLDLLQTGDTVRLDPVAPESRSRGEGAPPSDGEAPEPRLRYRTARSQPPAEPPPMDDPVLPSAEAVARGAARGPRLQPLQVVVRNGNLSFVDQPLFIGHYVSLELTGSERVVNERIGRTMEQALRMQAGHYPDRLGMHQAFINVSPELGPKDPGKPPAAIVVGLGPEGKLSERDLTRTVQLAVIDWLQRQHECLARTPADQRQPLKVAATLMGSGGVGISPAASARCITTAVVQANAHVHQAGWAPIAELQLIELYHDRATEAWRALADAEKDGAGGGGSEGAGFKLTPLIAPGTGAKRRPLNSGYRGADYDLVRITARGDGVIEYALDSRRARSEVREQSTQAQLVHQLVREASRAGRRDPDLSRALFRLLVPPSMEPYLRGDGGLMLDMNDAVASIPWELLDPGDDRFSGDAQRLPWAVRSGMIRRLQSMHDLEAGRRDSLADDDVLVIGDPLVPRPYAQLPEAKREAEAVERLFKHGFGDGSRSIVKLLTREKAQAFDVITTLQARDWRVVHIAGHGHWPDGPAPGAAEAPGDAPPAEPAASAGAQRKAYGGVVLSGDGIYLGPNEIRAMRVVPELVFINCCHLAKSGDQGSGSQQMAQLSRGEFAAGVATALIRLGVRCVVAAGWAIDDKAAERFAGSFYRELMDGRTFGHAVREARRATHAYESRRGTERSNTWAAYQCYGDPDWRLVQPSRSAAASRGRVRFDAEAASKRYAHIASASGLMLALESLTVDLQSAGDADARRRSRDEAQWLWRKFGADLGKTGEVLEAFGRLYEACGDLAEAIGMLELAVKAPDGSAPLKAQERLNNLRSRVAYEQLRALRLAMPRSSDPKDRRLSAFRQQAEQARTECSNALDALKQHLAAVKTPEAHALIGSAHKRMALVLQSVGDADGEQQQVEQMVQAYNESVKAARQARQNPKYPMQNLLAAQVRQWRLTPPADADRRESLRLKIVEQAAALRTELDQDADSRAHDVWQHLGLIELALVEAMVTQDADGFPRALARFQDLQRRFPNAATWRTSFDHWEFVLGPVEQQAPGSAEGRLLGELQRLTGAAGPMPPQGG